MRRHGDQVQRHFSHVQRHTGEAVAGVGMKQHAMLPTDRADGGQVLQRADFLVGGLNRDQDRLWCYRVSQLIHIHSPIPVHVEIGRLEALLFQSTGAIKDGEVLDSGGDDVRTFP